MVGAIGLELWTVRVRVLPRLPSYHGGGASWGEGLLLMLDPGAPRQGQGGTCSRHPYAAPCGIPKRRHSLRHYRWLTTAMHAGLMPNFLLLQLRRIIYLGVGVIAGTNLSGLVPSGGGTRVLGPDDQR
jgi:hypothetical protein